MSHSDDEHDSTNKTNIYKPYTANGQEILYLDNDATLERCQGPTGGDVW